MTIKSPAMDSPGSLEAPEAPSKGSFWHLYVTVWMVLAVGAVAYLVAVAGNPELARNVSDPRPDATAALDEGRRERLRIAADVADLKTTVGRLHSDVIGLQTTVEQQGRKVEIVSEKIAQAMREVPQTLAAAPPPTAGDEPDRRPEPSAPTEPPAAAKPAPATPPAAGKPRRTATPPLPVRVERPRQVAANGAIVPRIINRGAGAPTTTAVTTGSIPARPSASTSERPRRKPEPSPRTVPAAIKFGPAEVRSEPVAGIGEPGTRSLSAVTLSRASSLAGLKASWQALTELHPSLLGGLQPRYARAGDGTYQLLAGPFSDRATADRLCTSLRGSNIPCGVGAYGGNAL